MMSTEIVKPIGYYGCYCHPFEDSAELKKFEQQKIVVGEKYKIRCTQEECIVTEINERGFISIFVEPYDCARCNRQEHKQNLIKL